MKDDFELVEVRQLTDAASVQAAFRRLAAAPPGSITYSEKLHQEREARRKERRKKNKDLRRKLNALDKRFFSE